MGSDAYGATRFQDGCWLHGVTPYWQNIDPFCVTYGNSPKAKYYVPNRKLEQYLQKNGYNAQAVGAPILYDNFEAERIPNSILFMPSHGMPGVKTDWEAYFKAIIPIVHRYEYAAICLHGNDWKEVESYAGEIPLIQGATYDDRNALKRQIALFKQFETVHVNGFGSHIYYALYFDCYVKYSKTQITGVNLDYLKNVDPVWSKRPKLAEKFWKIHERMSAGFLRTFGIPRKDVYLGKEMLGYEESRGV